MTIYQIKESTKESSPHFFDRKTLKFFGQTLKSFSVMKDGNRYRIYAKTFFRYSSATEKREGFPTIRYFDPAHPEKGLTNK